MMEPDEYPIEYIVQSYQLPPHLERKIISIAKTRTEELKLFSFEAQYDYVAYLVERFTSHRTMSLDAPLSEDKTLYDLIRVEDANLKMLLDSPSEELLLVQKLPKLLRHWMSSDALGVLQQLLQRTSQSRVLNISQEEVIRRATCIQESLEQLAKRYGCDGKLIIPQRPITYVSFNPLQIKFGNRRYCGNPLAYYLAHQDIYGGMSRGELAQFDAGLYNTLRRYGQHVVIPKKKLTMRDKFRRYEPDPLTYFEAHIDEYRGLTRTQLNQLHRGLWGALKRHGQLDEAIASSSHKYSEPELELLKQKVAEGVSLGDLTSLLGRSESSISQKLLVLSKEDPRTWKREVADRYLTVYYRKYNSNYQKRVASVRQSLTSVSRRCWSTIDPLTYFKEHHSLYGRMNRTILFRFDPQLYEHLRAKDQLDEAIPETHVRRIQHFPAT